jgi:hypothetical protein
MPWSTLLFLVSVVVGVPLGLYTLNMWNKIDSHREGRTDPPSHDRDSN